MLDLIVKLRIVHQSTVLFTGIKICALHIAFFAKINLCVFIQIQKSVALKSFKCKLANQFHFEEMLLFKNTEMQVWKSPARRCEQIY